ncbi:MAG: 2'-5' RNA ligase [Candidatus Buchananbacteria bacterium RIFCSPHIGHO2_02_FULL_56_16]|uniref:RNA 2',3'-cyclic phosphodiesterase n=1 Tax=Candidatus Buchananbacteria bacterium RIFCSPHIGHO2_02_FULL_56_16 TaxID=1797542 RepID=A0A1G1YFH0_9BACT|nr:MAG: 2'-5' RNA ligase [Candidatus Buchananbacteria bacterium RIFCSPHIGHO2_02_FULL_56_16]
MKQRAFIAINLPKTAKQALATFIANVKTHNPDPALRYVKPDGLHLTLHFLGDLEPAQLGTVNTLLQKAAADSPPVGLELTNIGGFPSLEQPRVVVINARQTNGSSLIDFQQTIGAELERINIATDARPWTPHLTLARVNGRCRFQTQGLTVPPLRIAVTSIELMESRLLPSGTEYNVISAFNLTGDET